jgi:hypothetical protein
MLLRCTYVFALHIVVCCCRPTPVFRQLGSFLSSSLLFRYEGATLVCAAGWKSDSEGGTRVPVKCRQDGVWYLDAARGDVTTVDQVCDVPVPGECAAVPRGESLVRIALEASPELQVSQPHSLSEVRRWVDSRKRYLQSTVDANGDSSISFDEITSHLARVKVIASTGDGDSYSPLLPVWTGLAPRQAVPIDTVVPAIAELVLRGERVHLRPFAERASVLDVGTTSLGEFPVRSSTLLQLEFSSSGLLESPAVILRARNLRGSVAFALQGGAILASLLIDADAYLSEPFLTLEPSLPDGATVYWLDIGRESYLSGDHQGSTSVDLAFFESDLRDWTYALSPVAACNTNDAYSGCSGLGEGDLRVIAMRITDAAGGGTLVPTTASVLHLDLTVELSAASSDPIFGKVCLGVSNVPSGQGWTCPTEALPFVILNPSAGRIDAFDFRIPRAMVGGHSLDGFYIQFDEALPGNLDKATVSLENAMLSSMAKPFTETFGVSVLYDVYQSSYFEPSNEGIACDLHVGAGTGAVDCFESSGGLTRRVKALRNGPEDGRLGHNSAPTTLALLPESVAYLAVEASEGEVMASRCPPGWAPFGAACFRIFAPNQSSISSAHQWCLSNQADLVVVMDDGERQFVDGLVQEYYATLGLTGDPAYWVGLAYSSHSQPSPLQMLNQRESLRETTPASTYIASRLSVPSDWNPLQAGCVLRAAGTPTDPDFQVVDCGSPPAPPLAICELRPGVVLALSPDLSCPSGWVRLPKSRKCVKQVLLSQGSSAYDDAQLACGKVGGMISGVPAHEEDLQTTRQLLPQQPGIAWLGGYEQKSFSSSTDTYADMVSSLTGVTMSSAERYRLGLGLPTSGPNGCLAYDNGVGAWVASPCDTSAGSAICELMCEDPVMTQFSIVLNRCVLVQNPTTHELATEECQLRGGRLLSSRTELEWARLSLLTNRFGAAAAIHWGLYPTGWSPDGYVENYWSQDGVIRTTPIVQNNGVNYRSEYDLGGDITSDSQSHESCPYVSLNSNGQITGLRNDQLSCGATWTLPSACVLGESSGAIRVPALAGSIACQYSEVDVGRFCLSYSAQATTRAGAAADSGCPSIFLPFSAEENSVLQSLGGGWIGDVPPNHPFSNWEGEVAAAGQGVWVSPQDGLWRVDQSGSEAHTYACVRSISGAPLSPRTVSFSHLGRSADLYSLIVLHPPRASLRLLSAQSDLVQLHEDLLRVRGSRATNVDFEVLPNSLLSLEVVLASRTIPDGARVLLRRDDAGSFCAATPTLSSQFATLGECYVPSDEGEPLSFREAQLACEEMGGTLPILEDGPTLDRAILEGVKGWVGIIANQPKGVVNWLDGSQADLPLPGSLMMCGYVDSTIGEGILFEVDCSVKKPFTCQPYSVDILARITRAGTQGAFISVRSAYTGLTAFKMELYLSGLTDDSIISVRAVAVVPDIGVRYITMDSLENTCDPLTSEAVSPVQFAVRDWAEKPDRVCTYVNGVLQGPSADSGLGFATDVALLAEQSLVCVVPVETGGVDLPLTCTRAVISPGSSGYSPTSFFGKVDVSRRAIRFTFTDNSPNESAYELYRTEGGGVDETLVAVAPFPIRGCSTKVSSSFLLDDASEVLQPGKLLLYTIRAAGTLLAENSYELSIPWSSILKGSVETIGYGVGVSGVRVSAYLAGVPNIVFSGVTDILGEFELELSAPSVRITAPQQRVIVELEKASCRLRGDCPKAFQGPRELLLSHLQSYDATYLDQTTRAVSGIVSYAASGAEYSQPNGVWNCPVANATVVAIDANTGAAKEAITDANGAYEFSIEEGSIVDLSVQLFGYGAFPSQRRFDSNEAEYASGKAAVLHFELTEMRPLTVALQLPHGENVEFDSYTGPFFEAWVRSSSGDKICQLHFFLPALTVDIPALDFEVELSNALSGVNYFDADTVEQELLDCNDGDWRPLGSGACRIESNILEFFASRGETIGAAPFLGSEPGVELSVIFTFHPGYCVFVRDDKYLWENSNGPENSLGCFPEIAEGLALMSVEFDKDKINFELSVRGLLRPSGGAPAAGCHFSLAPDTYGSAPIVLDATEIHRVPSRTKVVVHDEVSSPGSPCFATDPYDEDSWPEECVLEGPWDDFGGFNTGYHDVVPGPPEIRPPFTRSIQFTAVRDAGHGYVTRTSPVPVALLVLGLRERPDKFAVIAPLKESLLFLVLRDPPGGGSSATWAAGTSVSAELSFDGMYATGEGREVGFEGGLGFAMEAGMAFGGWTAIVAGGAGVGGGKTWNVDTTASRTGSGSYTFSFSFETDISTSSDPKLAGTASDVLVGVGLTISKSIADYAEAKTAELIIQRLQGLSSSSELLDAYGSLDVSTTCVDVVPVDTWEPAHAATWVMNVITILQQVERLNKQKDRTCQDAVPGFTSASDCPPGTTQSAQLDAIEAEIGHWDQVMRQYATAGQDHAALLGMRSKFAQAVIQGTRDWRDGGSVTTDDLDTDYKASYAGLEDRKAGAYDAETPDDSLKESVNAVLLKHADLMVASCAAGRTSGPCKASSDAHELMRLGRSATTDAQSWSTLQSSILGSLKMDETAGSFDPLTDFLGGAEEPLGSGASISGDKAPFAFLKDSRSQYLSFGGGGEELTLSISFGGSGSRSVSVSTESDYSNSFSAVQTVQVGKGPGVGRRQLVGGPPPLVRQNSSPNLNSPSAGAGGTEKFQDKEAGPGAYLTSNQGGGDTLTASIGRASGTGTSSDQMVSMTFSDPDPKDFFVVEISSDLVFGTPYFNTVFGESGCFTETGTTGHFQDVQVEMTPFCGGYDVNGMATEGECTDLPDAAPGLFRMIVVNDSPTGRDGADFVLGMESGAIYEQSCSDSDLFMRPGGKEQIFELNLGENLYWINFYRSGKACLRYNVDWAFKTVCEDDNDACILPEPWNLMRDAANADQPCGEGAIDCVVSRSGWDECRPPSPLDRATLETVQGTVHLSWVDAGSAPEETIGYLEAIRQSSSSTETILRGLTELVTAGSECPGRMLCDADFDGLPDSIEASELAQNFSLCGDFDGDGCDDCSQGRGFNMADDGPDDDGDGICNQVDHAPVILGSPPIVCSSVDYEAVCTTEFDDEDLNDSSHVASMTWGDSTEGRCLIEPSDTLKRWKVRCEHVFASGGTYDLLLKISDGLPGMNEILVGREGLPVLDRGLRDLLVISAANLAESSGRRRLVLKNAADIHLSFICATPVLKGAPLECSGTFDAWDETADAKYAIVIDWGDAQSSLVYGVSNIAESSTVVYGSQHSFGCDLRDPVSPTVTIISPNGDYVRSFPSSPSSVEFNAGEAPTIHAFECEPPTSGFVGEEVVCKATFSDGDDDPSGHYLKVDWGGEVEHCRSIAYNVETGNHIATCGHVFEIAGSYALEVTATDVNGNVVNSGSLHFTVSGGVSPTVADVSCDTKSAIAGRDLITCHVALQESEAAPLTNGPYDVVLDWGDGSLVSVCRLSLDDLRYACDHTYRSIGSYSVAVTATDKRGNQSDPFRAVITVRLPAPVFVDSLSCLSAVLPGETMICTARFIDADNNVGHTAFISWSSEPDPQTCACSIGAPDEHGVLTVTCEHEFFEPASYAVTLVVTDPDQNVAESSAVAFVGLGAPPVIPEGSFLCSPAVILEPTVCTTHFADDATGAPLASAYITWSSEQGAETTVCPVSPGDVSGTFTVTCAHSYTEPGRYSATLVVVDPEGNQASSEAVADVSRGSPPVFVPDSFECSAAVVHGTTLCTATFSDADDASGHAAYITWSSEQSAETTVCPVSPGDVSGTFTVTCAHSYTEPGRYSATLVVVDPEGNQALSEAVADVSRGSPPVFVPDSFECSAAVVHETTLCTATFSDADDASGHAAYITWSIGSVLETSMCSVSDGGNQGTFVVTCKHLHTQPGGVSAALEVRDGLGNIATATLSLNVSLGSAPTVLLLSCPVAILGDISTCTASFDDDVALAIAVWGDSSDASVCSVTGRNVSCRHTYAAAGFFQMTLQLTDSAGLRGEATTNAVVMLCAKAGAQCGGIGWKGPTCCPAEHVCHKENRKRSICKSSARGMLEEKNDSDRIIGVGEQVVEPMPQQLKRNLRG